MYVVMHEWHIHLGHGEVCQIKLVAIDCHAGTDWSDVELWCPSGRGWVPIENGHSNGMPNDVRVPPDELLDEALERRTHRNGFVYGI